MKNVLTALALCLALTLLAAPMAHAQADVRIGPRLTVDMGDISDAPGSDFAIGADARVRATNVPFQLNGSFDYYSADEDLTFTTFDFNAVLPLASDEPSLVPYIGAGLGITRFSVDGEVGDFSASETEVGLNLVGGVELYAGALTPFAQFQFTNGDDVDRFGLTGGILIDI